jgi:hypothetical protein
MCRKVGNVEQAGRTSSYDNYLDIDNDEQRRFTIRPGNHLARTMVPIINCRALPFVLFLLSSTLHAHHALHCLLKPNRFIIFLVIVPPHHVDCPCRSRIAAYAIHHIVTSYLHPAIQWAFQTFCCLPPIAHRPSSIVHRPSSTRCQLQPPRAILNCTELYCTKDPIQFCLW